ncbi:hypothetical protein GSS88_05875 [Corynebacterium sp. 3HC-13]|uniref:hypothetical protein n=1 Tax=Corynebacterium poyangense TaxID=2684405 RepID=UPI001CCDF17D|nr:hypothetical protein [Corynebacterium poyangense]MBZ8177325.1 hypothetical protein [Corynebacterium poyangense]
MKESICRSKVKEPLSKKYENDDIAWKFAQFTLIFSIPKAAIPENNKKDGRIYLTAVEKIEDPELTSELTKGRDSGISVLKLRPEDPFKAYYKKSFSYFDSYFHDTLGSVEAENKEKDCANKVKFYHKKFISKDDNKIYRFYSEKLTQNAAPCP